MTLEQVKKEAQDRQFVSHPGFDLNSYLLGVENTYNIIKASEGECLCLECVLDGKGCDIPYYATVTKCEKQKLV